MASPTRPLNEEDRNLLARARDASRSAYARYSGLKVGAAVRTDSGKMYSGTNVENASYPLGMCAERNAIAAAVVAEGPDVEIVCLALVAYKETVQTPCSPCGGCRQVISELGPNADVIYYGPELKMTHTTALNLLPEGFKFDGPGST